MKRLAIQDSQNLELLLDQVLSAHEDLRGALARELHNELGALLTGMALDLSRLQSPSIPRSEEVEAALDSSLALLREAVILKRQFIEKLYPSTLQLLGLAIALETLAKSVSDEYGVQIDTFVDTLETPLRPGMDIDIYRVAEAALENVVRHSGSTTARLSLTEDDRWLVMVIGDDGAGFDIAAETRGKHMAKGIRLMRHRLKRWNGELHVESAAGAGATVTARVPLAGAGPAMR